jgi:hypothetical protein
VEAGFVGIACVGLQLLALALALVLWRAENYPLRRALVATGIMGPGCAVLVWLATPSASGQPPVISTVASPLVLTVVYLILTSVVDPWLWVLYRPDPGDYTRGFVRKKTAHLVSRLIVFVGVPVLGLHFLWKVEPSAIGLSLQNTPRQVWSAIFLALVLGGVQLVMSGGMRAVRDGRITVKQLTVGFVTAFGWNVFASGVAYECFYRGILQTLLVGCLGSAGDGILATSLLVGLMHVPFQYRFGRQMFGGRPDQSFWLHSILYSILVITPASWWTGLLYWRTGTILAPMLVRATIDAVDDIPSFIMGLRLSK